MKVMVLVKATEKSEAGEMPSTEMLEAMGAYNEELVSAGIMLDGDGLRPTSHGVRIIQGGSQPEVVDGPFAETKELLAGYWVWKVKDMDEAIEWARRAPNTGVDEGILELRPFVTAEDFGEALTPELEAKEEELRNRTQGS
mgnify:FL=1